MRMDKYSSPFAYVWSVITMIYSALSVNEWAALSGILVGVGTFLLNRYYKKREERRLEERQGWEREKFKLEYEILQKKAKGEKNGSHK